MRSLSLARASSRSSSMFMISGIASPLIARPPTMPPAGPTGRCKASTVPSNKPATRAASLNDMPASGPPSDTARIDLNIDISPSQTDAIKKRQTPACKPRLSPVASRCRAGELALSDPVNERQRRQHHPELAENLARKIVEAAERQPQEQDAVGHESDQARGQHRQHQPARLQRRIDGEVGQLGQQERGGRGID